MPGLHDAYFLPLVPVTCITHVTRTYHVAITRTTQLYAWYDISG